MAVRVNSLWIYTRPSDTTPWTLPRDERILAANCGFVGYLRSETSPFPESGNRAVTCSCPAAGVRLRLFQTPDSTVGLLRPRGLALPLRPLNGWQHPCRARTVNGAHKRGTSPGQHPKRLHSTMKRPAALHDEPHSLTIFVPASRDQDLMDRAEVQICGSLPNVSAVVGPFLDRLTEVEPDEDARIRVFGRCLRERSIRA